MRESRVLKKLRAGDVALCFKMNFVDMRIVQLAAMSGYDCIWTCMEHVPNSIETVERQVLGAKAHDTDVVVRVPRGSYSDYIRPLEMDAAGIMVPHVMNAEDAERIVQMTRFRPIGRRAIDGGNADGDFGLLDRGEYIRRSNEQKMVIVQIEDFEAVQQLDEIASVEGIDMLLFGPGDYCHSINCEYDFYNSEAVKVREKVVKTARKYNKFAGTVGNGSPGCVRELKDMGYQFINLTADVTAIRVHCTKLLERANEDLRKGN
jgi:4-hydroxy-2-oxoheptanedioate aldolase